MLNWFIKRMKKDQRGFTLIELVVVIAILGVLSAIAVPNVTGAISRARVAADKASALTIANAAKIYIVEQNIKDTDLDDLTGVVNGEHILVKDGYLDAAPVPQNSDADEFELTVTGEVDNPEITVTYNSETDNTVLYPPEEE